MSLAESRRGRRDRTPWRAHLVGFLVPLTLGIEAVAGLGRFLPDIDQFLSTNVRMLESLAPQLLVLALLLSLGVARLGARRAGLALALLALLAGAGVVRDYRAMRAPDPVPGTVSAPGADPGADPSAGADRAGDLRLLWFNMLAENPTPPARLVAAIRAAGADVVLLAEPAPLRGALADLADLYPYRLGCDAAAAAAPDGEDGDPDGDAEAGPQIGPGAGCGLVLLSRFPVAKPRFYDFPSGPERLLRVEITVPGHGRISLAGIHQTKPWYLGLTGGEADTIRWGLRRGRQVLPLVVAGDFNAAPWSLRMRRIHRRQELGFWRWPVSTWPAAAGDLGVPIDHVMVRDGAGIASLAAWGADLGSNHRGLIAEIDLPASRPGPDEVAREEKSKTR